MFLLIPLIIIVSSIIGIFIIVYRKKSYLDKLFVLNSSGSDAAGFLNERFNWPVYGSEFFPEIKTLIQKLKFHEYKARVLIEVEKLLRRTRLVSLRIDRFSDTLIKKIRRSHINRQLNGQSAIEISQEPVQSNSATNLEKNKPLSSNFLKNEEERLIIEIAKNPKDHQLYETLGDLYTEMDNFSDAKESYEAAIELNPSNEKAKQKLSSALEKIVQK